MHCHGERPEGFSSGYVLIVENLTIETKVGG